MSSALREFWEYEYVKRHTKDLDGLRTLSRIRVDRDRAEWLVWTLCEAVGLRRPRISFTGRSDRGFYEWGGRIIVRPSMISAETLVHELAHHWINTKMLGVPSSSHGADFVLRLDKLAGRALSILDEIELVPSTEEREPE